MLKGQKGITLVALVVTIIVLIILAGVSIALVLGQDGLISKTRSGRDNYLIASNEEHGMMTNVETWADGYVNATLPH